MFNEANNEIIKLLNEYSDDLNISPVRESINHLGVPIKETSHYSESENVIRLDERKDDFEYIQTLRHELGHFVDANLSRPSLTENFQYAIEADAEWFNMGLNDIDDLLQNLSGVSLYSRYISDILSGLFNDNRDIIQHIAGYYNSEGASFYGHAYSYWKGVSGPDNAVQREVFADLFAIYTENNTEIISFTEKWFPNASNYVRKCLEIEG